jgi:hypothetical protein
MKHKQIRKLIQEMFLQVYEKMTEESLTVEAAIPDATENKAVTITGEPLTDTELNSMLHGLKMNKKGAGSSTNGLNGYGCGCECHQSQS